ncbi:glycosyltransferase family 2 protein [Phycicoccus sp. M110.8]|uniref:glycosyltransferase family 2 protein n=1 Tax=Phycicoccus sp. M110.8 TaxID=3075433 RepID=UPI0028FDA9AD|nr:glycosyltransferase family 2 protein [Phycicoccus sp. M110.8]MDU0312707.1 glycosyltransferase family 2 protein [Phycicoccus sp. M110.8]
MTGTPTVTYVMPVLNEAARLGTAVRSVLAQDYPGQQTMVIAVGPSTDGTEEVAAELARQDSRVTVVDNPDAHIPSGLNRAISRSTGDVVVRVDAHTELPEGYTATMVDTLVRTGAANVGGVMTARGESPVQAAIARAYNSPVGLGGGVYHGGGVEGPADSAYLGVFRRQVLCEVGGFDETILRGEDYELNQRIIAAGHLVWLRPDVAVTYWPRSSWADLARQMWATGAWRGEIFRRQQRSPVRYLVAPSLVAGLAASLAVAGSRALGAAPSAVRIVHTAPVAYAAFLGIASVRALGGDSPRDWAYNAGALATMHVSWGAGFWKGFVRGAVGTLDRSRLR